MVRPLPRFLSLALPLLLAAACSGGRPAGILPAGPLLLWNNDQLDFARAENVWSGFLPSRSGLLANQHNPTVVFSLTRVPEDCRLTVVYQKDSPGRSLLKLNGKQALFLDPAASFRQTRRRIEGLHPGVNFLTFEGPVERLVVRTLSLGPGGGEPNRLEAGQSFRVSMEPGTLKLKLGGRARLALTTWRFRQTGEVEGKEEREVAVGFPLFRKSLTLDSRFPWLVKVKAVKGSLRLLGRDFSPIPAAASPESSLNRPSGEVKNVFIFLWDACQAKHLGLYGYGRPTAPFLSQFARDALLFRRAYANASFTSASVTSLFTGLYPLRHGRINIEHRLDPKVETLGGFFKSRGYATAVFTANANVSISSGLGRGIDRFEHLLDVYIKNDSIRLVDAFSDWTAKSVGPRFAYLHFMEPHFPLIPPPPFRDQYQKVIRPKEKAVIRHLNEKERFTPGEVEEAIADYDSDINYVDWLFGQAMERLKAQGLYDDSLIVLLADHGEACYEQGAWGHDTNLFPETVHIPLLIKYPKSFQRTGEVSELVQVIDLYPHLRMMIGGAAGAVDSPGLPATGESRPIFITGFPDQGLIALRWERWYYLLDRFGGQGRLFVPAEGAGPAVAASNPELAEYLRGVLLAWLRGVQRHSLQPVSVDIRTLSREEIDNLKTFGYL